MRIAVLGATGRMGRHLVQEVVRHQNAQISGATARAASTFIGQDSGVIASGLANGVTIEADTAAVITRAQAVIDFTTVEASLTHMRLAAQAGAAYICGTTGFDEATSHNLDLAARHIPVIYAANFSIGVTILTAITQKIAAILDDSYDIEILEMHHRHKVDAPSGTALALGQAAAFGRQIDHTAQKRWLSAGITAARETGTIGYAALRGGNVIGEHNVIFAGKDERIELGHKASDRNLFAAGAVRAAIWSQQVKAGRYDMRDVLGLKTL